MNTDNEGHPDVIPAFEMLLEEIEGEVARVNREGGQAFEAGQHERAAELLRLAGALTAIRAEVAALRDRWASALPAPEPVHEGERSDRRNLGRLGKGMRTREEAYRIPILRALDEMGGSAPMGEVLDAVGKAMARILKPVDLEPLPSDPSSVRWRNAAQWARNAMVKEGLLKDGSPRGVWEISESSRRELKRRGG